MLSRAGTSRLGLICSDCGTPQVVADPNGRPHPLVMGLTLMTLASFAMLLFFLTNWRPLPAQRAASQRAMINQLTTGTFVRDPDPVEKGGFHENE